MSWFKRKKEKEDKDSELLYCLIMDLSKDALLIYDKVIYRKCVGLDDDLEVQMYNISGDSIYDISKKISNIICDVTSDDIIGFDLQKLRNNNYIFRYGKINVETYRKDKEEKEYNRLKPYIEKYLKENGILKIFTK